ncbi:MAG: hypothetical protein A2V88_13975 [Elusimicrobia bacterium RBG_16_66_12]|nr:MAG: hypothetical protein A2V88_13975 [Elusimicrobia bacterium RBG_16_66_12]
MAITGDWHIGSYGSHIDPQTGRNARMADISRTCWEMMCNARIAGCTALLHLGDMYRSPVGRPTPTEEMLAVEALRNSPGDSIILVGNHDGARDRSESNATDVLALLGMTRVYDVPDIDQRAELQIAYIPYPSKSRFLARNPDVKATDVNAEMGRGLAAIAQHLAEQIDPGRPSILIGHVAIDRAETGEGSLMSDKDICLRLADIPDVFTWRVFGHVHKPQQLDERTWIVGSPERISFNEEGDKKRWLLLDTDTGVMESVPTAARAYYTLRVSIKNGAPYWELDLKAARDAVCRAVIERPENVTVDESAIRRELEAAGCHSIAAITHEVQRAARSRSEAISAANTEADVLAAYVSTRPDLMAVLDEMQAEQERILQEVIR